MDCLTLVLRAPRLLRQAILHPYAVLCLMMFYYRKRCNLADYILDRETSLVRSLLCFASDTTGTHACHPCDLLICHLGEHTSQPRPYK